MGSNKVENSITVRSLKHLQNFIIRFVALDFQIKLGPVCSEAQVNGVRMYSQLRAKRLLMLFNDVPLRTRKVVLLYKDFGYGTLLRSINALLVLSQ